MAMEAKSVEVEGYKPGPEFVEGGNEALVDLNSLTQSTELWLLQLPFSKDFSSEIDGQELSLKLHHDDGQLATFQDSSGKVYDFLSFADQEPDETVFVSSATEPRIAGKISRRVSICHYPDPKELKKLNSTNTRQTHPNSAGISGTTSSRYFPTQSGNLRSSQSGHAASSKGSRHKSSLSEVSELSNTTKRRIVSESIMTDDQSNQDISNGRHVPEFSQGHSTGISSLSSDHSHGGKSKRRKHKE